MKEKFKQRAPKRHVSMVGPLTKKNLFSRLQKALSQCVERNGMHGHTIQQAQELLPAHPPLSIWPRQFLGLQRRCFQGVRQTFLRQLHHFRSAGRYITRSTSHLLRTLIEFSLSTLCEILNLPKEGDHIYLSAYDKFPAFGKSESKGYSLISVDGKKRNIATRRKPDFRVISKWFIGNVVPWRGHNDYLHPLQAMFLYSYDQIGGSMSITSSLSLFVPLTQVSVTTPPTIIQTLSSL